MRDDKAKDGAGGSQQAAAPTDSEEEKQGLERLLDALTPQRKHKNSPKSSPNKQPASMRGSVGFRRSMRSSLSIQLGIVAATQSVGGLPAAASSTNSKSSSSGLGSSSSRFRGLGALSSPDVTPASQGATPSSQRLPPHPSSNLSSSAGEPGESTFQRALEHTDQCLIGR